MKLAAPSPNLLQVHTDARRTPGLISNPEDSRFERAISTRTLALLGHKSHPGALKVVRTELRVRKRER